MGKKNGNEKENLFDLIENFVDELICNGIQKKKPKAIPNVWNERKGKHGKA